MDIMDAFEITRGLRSELSEPIDDDPNRYLEWDAGHIHIKMDQYDGYIYLKDGDATISMPSNEAHLLAKIMEIADRVTHD
jgi:hypothetical protein